MKNKQNLSNIFDNFTFPTIENPIAYNADSDNLTNYMKKLSTDDAFLKEEAQRLGKEVAEMLAELEEKGIIKI